MRFAFFASSLSVVVAVACGGSTAASVPDAGASGQQLQTKTDGTATGDGATCSWSGTALLEKLGGKSPTYQVGSSFQSLDGCNTCSCTASGITCTALACSGSSSGTSGTTGGPTGISSSSSSGSNTSGGIHACPAIAKACPDGSFVSPEGPDCVIPDCPAVDCTSLAQAAQTEVSSALNAHSSCSQDQDCVTVDLNADCFESCSRGMNKNGQSDFAGAQGRANANQCQQFKAQGCKEVLPPCAAPDPTPHCTNHSCQ